MYIGGVHREEEGVPGVWYQGGIREPDREPPTFAAEMCARAAPARVVYGVYVMQPPRQRSPQS